MARTTFSCRATIGPKRIPKTPVRLRIPSRFRGTLTNTRAGQLVRVRGMSGVGGYLALDDVVNLEHFWLTGVDAELGENRHEACSERLELFL